MPCRDGFNDRRVLAQSVRPLQQLKSAVTGAIVQDAEAYQRLLDIAARSDAEEGIRQGLEDAKKGRSGRRGSFSTSSKPRMAYLVNIISCSERTLRTCTRKSTPSIPMPP